jgi:probable aminopeptidase NPEPL1
VRDGATSTIVIGRHAALKSLLERTDSYVSLFGFRPHPEILSSMRASLGKGNAASTSHVVVPTVGPAAPRPPHRMCLVGLKDGVTRNNHPLSLHAMTDLVKSNVPSGGKGGGGGIVRIVVCAEGGHPLAPMAMAIARAFPLFTRKTVASKKAEAEAASATTTMDGDDVGDGDEGEGADESTSSGREIHVTFVDSEGRVVRDEAQLRAADAAAEGVRLACRLVDAHPDELTTTAYANECRALFGGDECVTMEEIVGEELRERGYGGIYNVGRCATEPPRLIILTYDPPTTDENIEGEGGVDAPRSSIALVGKGIVYDTGGLAIKWTGMNGMKHDMGGSAGVLGGFYAAVRLRTRRKIRLLLCLAENAIGPKSIRNDDIVTLYSGKTVEINNSDAEGRLVLSDAVAHVTRHYADDTELVVDMATLTGAQLIATGKIHAAILANTEELEKRAVNAGLESGDLCYPLLYAPELLKGEFSSKVADMKNSVKDRSNAQCSCAGHFIEDHIDPGYKGGWLHVDMAGPGTKGERGTGYGVGLVLSLVEAPGFAERS